MLGSGMRHIRSDAMIKGIAGLNWSILMAIPILSKGFSGGTVIKNPPTNAGDMGSIPGSGKIPWRRKWQSTPVLLLGKSHRQGSLVSYTLWGHKELDMPEHIHILSFSFFSHTSFLINIQAHNASQALTGPKYSEEWSQPPVNRRGIPSSPLALLIVMLPKAHLTSHSRMSGSRWVTTPSWFSGSWRSLYSSSVYSCHLFLISFAYVRSIPFLSFIVPIFAQNVPLVSLIFLKRSLVFAILFFPLFLCIDHWGKLSCLSLLFFGTLHSNGYIFPFLLWLLLLSYL